MNPWWSTRADSRIMVDVVMCLSPNFWRIVSISSLLHKILAELFGSALNEVCLCQIVLYDSKNSHVNFFVRNKLYLRWVLKCQLFCSFTTQQLYFAANTEFNPDGPYPKEMKKKLIVTVSIMYCILYLSRWKYFILANAEHDWWISSILFILWLWPREITLSSVQERQLQ